MKDHSFQFHFEDPNNALAEAERRIHLAYENRDAELNLDELGLTDIPNSILSLNSLSKLNLSHNRLRQLPDYISQLPNLRDLDLGDNPLETVPQWIGDMRRLRHLSLYANRLAEVPPSIRQLKELESLGLGGNNISEIPLWLGSLRKLRTLLLWNNRISTVPDCIGELTELEILFLYGNQLRELSPALTKLTNLRELYLHDNDELRIPTEVLGPKWSDSEHSSRSPANPQNILDYYFRTRTGKSPLNEAKLIILGRGEVGKTCLVNRLVFDKFRATSLTRGIAITQWPILTNDGTIRLHVWDFGGQEIQHATHQFFLTERSLYLVVLNGRAGAEDEDAEYWLKFVKTFGGSSPTIVVLNKSKIQPFQVNRRALQSKYPFIRAFVETDCRPKLRNGIPDLRREIEQAITAMDHVRADFPLGWFQIKERLAEMKEPFISFDEYRKICNELGESDAQGQEQLAIFLNALGVALNFRGDPQLREETVLNPHWITEGVYHTITSKRLATKKGELRLSDLADILPRKDYPPRMHGFIVELMRKFELCFPFHDDPSEKRYLVPELLGKEEPAIEDFFQPNTCLNFKYEYRLMPEGLLPRFITRTHTMSGPVDRWRSGVVLRWEGCRALVKADRQERQVIVRVTGDVDKRRRLLAVIRENFDRIHIELREFKPVEFVALESHPAEWVNCLELGILEQRLVKFLPKSVGQRVMSVDVSKVLDSTELPGVRQKRGENSSKTRPLKIFISYAHEDEKWREKLSPNLDLLQREGLVEIWCDLQIKAGEHWDEVIKRKLEEAELYIFLMSTDLLVSDYVQKTELPIAKKRHEKNRARLVPVIVRRCSWTNCLGEIQGLPTAGKPIKEWIDKDQAFHSVEMGLRKTIADVRSMLWEE